MAVGKGAQPDPHGQQQIRSAGPSPEQAHATLLLLHGRGASADSILALHAELDLPSLAAIAPQAAGHTWYPYSFLAPFEENQPFLDSALRRVESLVSGLFARGVASERIVLLGFSQGACLACESVARHPRKYGAAIAFPGRPGLHATTMARSPERPFFSARVTPIRTFPSSACRRRRGSSQAWERTSTCVAIPACRIRSTKRSSRPPARSCGKLHLARRKST